MAVNILRPGSKGKDVSRWQLFLVGRGHLKAVVDGDFGPRTEKATVAFQRAHGLSADGVVGPKTLGVALAVGFDLGFSDPQRKGAEPLLPEPPRLRPLVATAARQAIFGEFEFEAAPTPTNLEAIRILGTWEADNIETLFVPQLKGKLVFGARKSSGRMRFHRLAVSQLSALWAAWDEAGFLDRVLTYDGSFIPRFARGSVSELSNHAFGTAFDINAKWNRLGMLPPLPGHEGSVQELVAIASEHGFFWGGHFKKRRDGMHFEVAKIVSS